MKERKNYLDYLRVISTFAVVMIHVFTTAKTDFPNHTEFERIITATTIHLLHFCVPIFLMITGTLFLNPNKKIIIKDYFKKYILRYIIILFTFGFAFSILENFLKYKISFKTISRSFLDVLTGNTWEHMWYIYMLIGVLMLLPIIKVLCDNMTNDKKLTNYFLVVGLIACFIYPTLEIYFKMEMPIAIPLFSNCIYYLFAGYLIDTKKISISNLMATILITTGMIIIIAINIICPKFNITWLYQLGGYDSIVVLSIAVGIFAIAKNKEIKLKNSKIINHISNISFGMYLIHMFWINLLYKIIKFNIYGGLFIPKSLIVFLLVSVLTIISASILKIIPIVKKYI